MALFLVMVAAGCSPAKPAKDVPMRPSRVEGPAAAHDAQAKPPVATTVDFGAVLSMWEAGKALREGKAEIRERLGQEPMFKKAMTAALEARGWEFFFSTPDRTAQALQAVVEAVRALPDHGLKTEGYPIEALEKAEQAFTAAASRAAEPRKILESLPAWGAIGPLVEKKDAPAQAEWDGLKTAGRLKDVDQGAFAEVTAAWQGYVDAAREGLRARADIEVAAMVAFFKYALDMKYLVLAHPFEAEGDIGAADTRHLDDLVKAFERFATDPRAGIDWFTPKTPYYKKIQEGLARYRKLAAAGPFKEVDYKGKLKKGVKAPAVQAVKERLTAEGYYSGVVDEAFDQGLEDAVKLYQSTHQYDQTGVLEERHAKSLNIPMERRVRQIELSLRRFREGELRPEEPVYVRVNIPEFMMEVWADGKRVQKHKVCTGNNNLDRDPDAGISGRINRTKLFTATIQKVIMNPKWHVPGRIQKLELDYELLKEPDYYKKHGFKVKVLPDGREEIYQDSGAGNALGRVKFLFPNPFGIYMHDTPQKPLFAKEIRAFSHGCIRLQEPLEVAFFILEKCAGMTEDEAREVLKRGAEKEIALTTKVPIFVEYNTVGVDDEGRLQFFADPYDYDRDYWDGKLPYPESLLRVLRQKVRKGD